jgi:hypothetical protein
MAMKGKWAQGITPRHFSWVLRDKLAVSERPGGYGQNHRKVRRTEEIIWIREQGFTCVVSLIASPHNLHNYDELGVVWRHAPFTATDDAPRVLAALYPDLRTMLGAGGKVLIHHEEMSDRVTGVVAGYLLWSGLLPTAPDAVSGTERLLGRPLGPVAREIVAVADRLRAAS